MSQKEDMHIPEGYTSSVPTHNGPLLGVLVIILALILGGLYLWGSMTYTEPVVEEVIINNEPETPRAEADVQILNTISPSDDLGAIESDIENTDIDSLDAELTAMEMEMEAALGE